MSKEDFGLSVSPADPSPEDREMELSKILSEWNRTSAAYPAEKCIHQLFEEQARRAPEALAVIEAWGAPDNRTLTYQDLNARANQLAHYLRDMGVGSEKVIGICLQRSLEMVIAILGVIKSGAAYVLLDPDYPARRLAFMVEDAHANVLLTQHSLQDRLDTSDIKSIDLDQEWEVIARQSLYDPINIVLPDNLVYLIYTSGSTGNPKGAMIHHRALCNHMSWVKALFPMDSHDRVLVKSPISFDGFEWEFFTGLLSGAALVMAMPGRNWDAGHLLNVIQEMDVTSIMIVPSFLRVMVEDPRSQALSGLRWLFIGGEALPSDLVERINGLLDVDILNLYGPAEACIDTIYYQVPRRQTPPIIPIGRPIFNTQAYILDDRQQLLPPGETGELYLGGDNLGRGYYRNPALTAERFIPNPFDGNGSRLYRTGDLARYLPGGDIEYLGRVDFQVKIRGSRVELGEIERWLFLHPTVREAAIVARPVFGAQSDTSDLRLAAFIQLRENARLTTQELRAYLADHLPDYMVPTTYTFLDSLPHSTSGKVDRQALIKFDEPSRIDRQIIPPRNSVEKSLIDIWSEVLGVKSIGTHDNFLELGGHSLALAQVMARIYERYQVEMPIAGVVSVPDIAQMAEQIERNLQTEKGVVLLPIQPVRRDGVLPLSYQQEQVWFLLAMEPESLAYNFQITIRLFGKLDREALQRTFNEIIRRHEIYRTTFSMQDGIPVQKIHKPWKAQIPLIDLSGLTAEEKKERTENHLQSDFALPFDITRVPLIKWKLVRITAEEHLLVHLEHHLVHDGWSFAVLMQEFVAIYSAFATGNPSPLPELEIQFADYAIWQRQNLQGEYLAQRLKYWRDRLQGAPPLLGLPTDHPRPREKSYRGSSIQIDLDRDFYKLTKSFSLREGVTLFTTFLAAFEVLLYRYTGQQDLVVGSGFANRRMRQTESLIGMFVNSVVLRTDLSGDIDFRELLSRVGQTISGASAYQDMPFNKLVEALQPERNPGYNPFFQVHFSFHDSPIPELIFPDLYGSLEHRQNKSAKFDLNVIVIPRPEQLHHLQSPPDNRDVIIVWEYDTDLFDRETMQRMLEHYLTLIKKLIDNPTEKISRIGFLSDEEWQRTLVEWNATKSDYPADRSVQDLFLDQVRNIPTAEAVRQIGNSIFGTKSQSELIGSMTYQQLNEASNRLARSLRARSVGPGSIVGVCMERGIDAIQAFIAILKAGAAYLPLDVSHPVERLRFMTEDSGSTVVLCDEKNLRLLEGVKTQVICLDRDREVILRQSGLDLPSHNASDELAYVMYTSGSTGLPKGSGIPHRAINRLVCKNNYLQVRPGDRVAQVTNTSFDLTTFEVWGALLNGGCLVIIPQETLLSPPAFVRAVRQERIDVLCIATALFNHIASAEPGAFQTIREVIFGGEAAAPDVLRKILQEGGPQRLLNGYGPTENTTWTTYFHVKSVPEDAWSIPIGQPVSNTRVYILDQWLNPTAVGVPGEIYNAGDGLAHDYLHHPEMTAEKFLPDPFGATGERMYRTGDLGRYLPDGNIEFLGRIDQQIKLRGFRVELGEIEAVLESHTNIRKAAVLLREVFSANKLLVAYLVFQPGCSMDARELRDYLSLSLPSYMIPSIFLTIPAMPLTPNGKLDRKALPPPPDDQLISDSGMSESLSAFEKLMLQIWSEVLGRSVTSLRANFFELGGHSLLGIKLLHQIANLFELQPSPRLIYEAPTVAALSSVIQEMAGDQERLEKTAQLLLDMGDLSDDRVQDLLGAGRNPQTDE